jgi:hypothetical protein
MTMLPTALGVLGQGKRLALVIGVNRAPNSFSAPLKYADADAEAMANVLKNYCHFELLMPPLVNEQANSERVKDAVRTLARDRTDDDFLLLYFSGHGFPMTIEAGRQDIYLVTSNFSQIDVKEDENAHFSMRWLRDKFYIPTQAGRVLIILDCCYAGDFSRTAQDPYLEDLKKRINYYFGPPGEESGALSGGARLALTATGHNSSAMEKDGYGPLTYWLLPALRGEVDAVIEVENQGSVSLQRLHRYLEITMSPELNPSISGDYAGRPYILASYPERAAQLRNKLSGECRPRDYIPFPPNPLFQPRPGEFESLETLLFGSRAEQNPARVGLIGIVGLGGVGKTALAAELAYRYQNRYPSGVFWMPAGGTGVLNWVRQFANLALDTEYLPPDDNVSFPENETRRTRYFCAYLANHADALLILDNVEDSDFLIHVLPILSVILACSILYTSRINLPAPEGVIYRVFVLPESSALRTLLETTRPALLQAILVGSQEAEAIAARSVCMIVGHLPLALTLLRSLLAQDQQVTLLHLAEVLTQEKQELAGMLQGYVFPLFATLRLSWERVHDEETRRLFKLASFFPEAVPIPLWLLGIAVGLGESANVDKPLGKAYVQLQELGLMERLSDDQVRLHPLIRAFGRRLIDEDGSKGRTLLEEAGEHLTFEFADLNKLEQRAQREGYRRRFEQVRTVEKYLALLGTGQIELLKQAEQALNRES